MSEAATNLTFFSGLLASIAERGRAWVGIRRDEPLGVGQLLDLCQKLLKGRGEASEAATARAILDGYAALDVAGKRAFLEGVTDRFVADVEGLTELARTFLDKPDAVNAARLFERAEPPRQELIRRLNHAPDGTLDLVKMREDLLEASREIPRVELFDRDFRHLFSSWFNRGFLVLRRIDWSTPANILEKIIQYEAVHTIHDWDDLRRRLAPPDRRLYGFFHPAIGDEPLIFVEVALTPAIPDAIESVLARDRAPIAPGSATTAVFYSISNAQKGLAGVSFGNFLIKQVVEDLKHEWPNLTTFVTLSPAPGFAAWLKRERANPLSPLLNAETRRLLAATDQPGWLEKPGVRDGLAKALPALAAHYYLNAKSPSNRPPDPVARFHLGNGARLERLNPFGDLSVSGLKQSLGLMVNYLYDLDRIEQNHEAFANRGEVAASSAIKKLAPPPPAPKAPAKAAEA